MDLNNLFNKNNCKNMTSKLSNIEDFKNLIIKSKDETKYYYLIIDDLKYKLGLYLNYIFEKLEMININMIIINKGSLLIIRTNNINHDFNINVFNKILNDVEKNNVII